MNHTDENPHSSFTELNYEEILRAGKNYISADEEKFNKYRKEFLSTILPKLYKDREKSYNKVGIGPTKGYAYGLLTAVDLIYEKASRLRDILWPTNNKKLSKDDVKRLLGSLEDIAAFSSFAYSMLKILIENKMTTTIYTSNTPIKKEIITKRE